jgi:hypothetical protein
MTGKTAATHENKRLRAILYFFNMLFTLTLTPYSYFFPISLKTLSLASEIFRTS